MNVKKVAAIVAIAGALVLGGSAAANAAGYPPEIDCTVSPSPVAAGGSATISCPAGAWAAGVPVTITATGPGVGPGTLARIAFTADTTFSITKPAAGDGSLSALFTAPTTPGTVTIVLTDGEAVRTLTETVTAAPAPTPTTPGLPPTGNAVPATAIWLGVGAIGIGGIAVVAAVARRRAHHDS